MLPLKDVIIGADGPFSRVGRWIGASSRNLIPAAQVRVNLTHPMGYTKVYFDRNVHGGYGWVFPKGKVANVGIGVKRGMGISGSVKKTLDYFLSQLEKQGVITGKHLQSFGGWIPIGPVKKTVHDNILLAGDAAGHTHSITGAGIFTAVTGGRMAGKWASEAVEKCNLRLLKEYEKEWQESLLERCWNVLSSEDSFLKRNGKRCWVAFREYYGEPAITPWKRLTGRIRFAIIIAGCFLSVADQLLRKIIPF